VWRHGGRKYTPLHIACAGGHAECVQLLLGEEPAPFLRLLPPHLPLHPHTACGRLSACADARAAAAAAVCGVRWCCLSEAGCDPTLREASGLTGWELAAQLQRASVLALRH
jgi:ankyrin repeat protein